tara:strand:+ start:561 stop:782 length:222 start_codon:yes stop_codon:yes gene_type:complete
MKIVNQSNRVGKAMSDMSVGDVFKWDDEYLLVVELSKDKGKMKAFDLTTDRMQEWELDEDTIYEMYAAEIIVS